MTNPQRSSTSCRLLCENRLSKVCATDARPIGKASAPTLHGKCCLYKPDIVYEEPYGKRMIENALPSGEYVHCSVPIEDTKHDTRDSETLEESNVLKHHIQLFCGIQEVSNARPNHRLCSEPKGVSGEHKTFGWGICRSRVGANHDWYLRYSSLNRSDEAK